VVENETLTKVSLETLVKTSQFNVDPGKTNIFHNISSIYVIPGAFYNFIGKTNHF